MSRATSLLAALVALAPLGCGGPEAEPTPVPPDVQPLLTRFSTIDGVLDADTARALIDDAVTDAVVLVVIGALLVELDAAADGLDRATDETSQSAPTGAEQAALHGVIGQQTHGLTLAAGGWVELTHICPGADRAVVDPANGAIRLRSVLELVSGQAVVPEAVEIWGEATDCRLDTEDGPATLQAAIVGVMSVAEGNDLLVSLRGSLTTPEEAAPSTFDITVRQAGPSVELLRTVEGNGSFLVGLDAMADATTARLTDSGGVWTCTFDVDAGSGRCARGEELLTWP